LLKTGIEFVSLIQFQQIIFHIEAMGFRNTMGPSANLQIKADGCEKREKNKIFSTASILVRGVAGGLG
jgi:hypothetical protein